MMKSRFKDIGIIYRRFYKKHSKFFLTLVSILMVCSMTPLLDTFLNVWLIDYAIPKGDMKSVFLLLGIFSLIYLLNITIGFVIQIVINKKNNEIVEEMKLYMASGLHKSFIDKSLEEKSRITVVLVEDIMIIISFMSSTIISVIIQISIIMTFAIYLIRNSLLLSIITFLFSFIQALTVPIFANPLKKTSEEFRLNSEDELWYINSAMTNMKMINLFGRISESLERYKIIISRFKVISLKNLKTGATQDMIVGVVSLTCNVLTISVGAYLIINNKLTLGVFVAFLSLNGTINAAFGSIFSFNSAFQSFKVSTERFITSVEAYPDDTCTGEELTEISNIQFYDCCISIDGVVISRNINCCIDKGSKNLIVGANGCGKSSMFNLLCGFLPVEKGMLMVSGKDINDINLDSLKSYISCCFQDNYFLQDTVRRNICAHEDLIRSAERFDSIVELLDIDRSRLDERLDSCVSGFSGGELQRISIARALMRESDLYLFDEPFSNIEEKMKTKIFLRICEFLENKIVVIISHDKEIYEEAKRLNINCCLFDDMIRN